MMLTLTNQTSSASATDVARNAPSASNDVARNAPSASNADPAQIPHTMPAFISTEEAYFWSFSWQEGIREALAAREAGQSRVFDSDDPNDVVRWLLSDDES
jgi:hypothetical protein